MKSDGFLLEKRAITCLCDAYLVEHLRRQRLPERSVPGRMASFRRRRQGDEIPCILFLVQMELTDSDYRRLESDVNLLRELLDTPIPANDRAWVQSVGRSSDVTEGLAPGGY